MKKSFAMICICMIFLLSGCMSESTSSHTPVSSCLESASELESGAEAEATALEEEPTLPLNFLTGEEQEAGYLQSRPLAMVIDNSDGRDDFLGLERADVVFEIPITTDETRYLALYSELDGLDEIGSAGVSTESFFKIAKGFDALLVSWEPAELWGCAEEIGADSLDASRNELELFYHAEETMLTRSMERSAVLKAALLAEKLAENEIRTELKVSSEDKVFSFEQNAFLPDTLDAGEVRVDFGRVHSDFVFDIETGTYHKKWSEASEAEGQEHTPLFKNVFILETDIAETDDNALAVNIGGKKAYKGYYVSMGGQKPIMWSKADEQTKIEFCDMQGNELKVNEGKSYIGVVAENTKIRYIADELV